MNVDVEKIIALVKSTKGLIHNQELREQVKKKGPGNYVTQVDMNVQTYLQRELNILVPEAEFMGEETGVRELRAESFWILDPVDGTANLVHGYQCSAVSLGLYSRGEVVLGIIYDPFREELFYAEKGKGAFLNGRPIHVAEEECLSETIVAVGTLPYYKDLGRKNFARLERIYTASEDIRRTGSAAIDLANTAAGRQGGYFEEILQPWDFAAGKLLVEEAGGRVTDFAGQPVDVTRPGSVLASNGKLHAELLSLL